MRPSGFCLAGWLLAAGCEHETVGLRCDSGRRRGRNQTQAECWADKREGKRRLMAFRALLSLQPVSGDREKTPVCSALRDGMRLLAAAAFFLFLRKTNEKPEFGTDGKKMTHTRGWCWRVGSVSRGLDRAGATRATALHGAHPISAPVKYRYIDEGGARGPSAPEKRGTVAMRPTRVAERHLQHAREGYKNALACFLFQLSRSRKRGLKRARLCQQNGFCSTGTSASREGEA